MTRNAELKKGEQGAWISIVAYISLACAKLVISYIGESDALKADGLNNTTDVIASIAVLIGLKISRRPPDEDHHYGHYRAESIASLFAAFIMVTVGIQVILTTAGKLIAAETAEPRLLTAWTALAGAIVMYIVYRYNLRLSKKTDSQSLYAAAKDNRSDALVSIGAFIGILGAHFGLYWLDPLTGFIVGLIICITAWNIFKDATHALTDGFDEQRILDITQSVYEVSDVKEVTDVKGRVHGNMSLLDITILVDPDLDVKKSHDITVRIERLLENKHRIKHAQIHIEPYSTD